MNTQVFAGKFEIQGEISQGATGTIYYGYDLELRQEVAIKIYHSHINGRLVRGKTFIEKTKPLLKLDHPNLIKIFKVEEDNDTPIVFMEFFDGPSLQQIIREKGPLSVEHMLILAQGIAEVLVHTHFQGLIHGTLHPGHVLVGPQNQIKVMDLGLSWILMDILSNCDEDLLRPLPYLPPERAKGEPLTLSSDLYSLGFMMYEMLTKATPYACFPKTSIMGKLAFDQSDPPFNFPESVPDGVRDLIYQITRNKAQDRLQDATHVLTIINQQLAKLSPGKPDQAQITEGLRKPKSSQPLSKSEAPTPRSLSPGPENSIGADISEAPYPPYLTPPTANAQTPAIEHPTQGNYKKSGRNTNTWKRNLGFILGVLLLIVGGSLGYWFRDALVQKPYLASPPLTLPLSKEPMPRPTRTPVPAGSFAQEGEETTAIPPHAVKETLSKGPHQKKTQSTPFPVNEQTATERIPEEQPPQKLSTDSFAHPSSLLQKQKDPKQTESPILTPTALEPITTIPEPKPPVSSSKDTPVQKADPPTLLEPELSHDAEIQKLLESVEAMEEPSFSRETPFNSPPPIPEPQH